MTKQVAVTGVGIFCPLGESVDELISALMKGQCALGKIQAFDTSKLKIQHSGEIANYDPTRYFDDAEVGRLDRTAQFGILAARSAIRDAGLSADQLVETNFGLVVGVCAGGQGDPPSTTSSNENPFAIRLDDFPETAIFAQTDAIVADIGMHGPHNTISTACASSGSALGVALDWVRSGRCQRVLVGGTDAFSVATYAGFYALGAMAPVPMSPFSEGIGVTFGEGAGFVVIESLESAQARGAKIYGELMGRGLTGDAHHVTSPHPGGEGLNRAMRLALKQADLTPADVDYFNAHGTGTRDNDTAETQAIRELYEDVSQCPAVSSTKSYFGHTLGAAGILEFIVSLLASRDSFIPPTINFESQRQGCDLDYVPNVVRHEPVNVFVSNSAAFGGINASIVGGRVRSNVTVKPSSVDEVWITGTGVVSPVGCGNEEFAKALHEGKSGIRPVDRFNVEGLRNRHAALVPEFNARKVIPTVDTRRAETMNRYAMVASGLALQSSGINLRSADPTRLGLIMALTYGSVSVQESFRKSLMEDGIENLSAKYFPSMVVSTIGGQVSLTFKLQGVNNTVVAGVTAGLHALAHGYELLRNDADQDALVVVGADEIGELMFKVFNDRGWTAESIGDELSLNMYGAGKGIIMGEGSGAVVIERASAGKARGAKPLARVAGFGSTNDGAAFRTMESQGTWLAKAIEIALADAGKATTDIDWVLTHGRGDTAYDAREIRALRQVFSDKCPPVSCIAGHVGVGGASLGMFSTIAAVQGMQRGEAFATVSTSVTGDCGIPLVCGAARPGNYRNVLLVGSTEHGGNTAIVLERFDA
ncbi:MAG: beta-ketoacyl-[acyl-carrier-protein] synthase family protein [Pirellulaceae bacterium]|nr:beta-ketoacyl-[acyl-carrier-protein] synthase family protein [Pirellulaceae bacterium]